MGVRERPSQGHRDSIQVRHHQPARVRLHDGVRDRRREDPPAHQGEDESQSGGEVDACRRGGTGRRAPRNRRRIRRTVRASRFRGQHGRPIRCVSPTSRSGTTPRRIPIIMDLSGRRAEAGSGHRDSNEVRIAPCSQTPVATLRAWPNAGPEGPPDPLLQPGPRAVHRDRHAASRKWRGAEVNCSNLPPSRSGSTTCCSADFFSMARGASRPTKRTGRPHSRSRVGLHVRAGLLQLLRTTPTSRRARSVWPRTGVGDRRGRGPGIGARNCRTRHRSQRPGSGLIGLSRLPRGGAECGKAALTKPE